MSINMKIFQLYYKTEQFAKLDGAFTPYNNIANPRPELREWYIWDKEYETLANSDLDYWGFVSWKFKDKTNLMGQQLISYIEANPGYDLYFVNPCLINEAVFENSWVQGDLHHPNISDIGNSFLKKLGHDDVDVREMLLDRHQTMFANYIIGSKTFWAKFMEFSRRLFTEAEVDPVFREQVFGMGKSNYSGDPTLPMFTFLIERLIPTFIELYDISALPYQYTADTIPDKYKPIAADLSALSSLKVLINDYDSDGLYGIWDYYRSKFLSENPGVLGLE